MYFDIIQHCVYYMGKGVLFKCFRERKLLEKVACSFWKFVNCYCSSAPEMWKRRKSHGLRGWHFHRIILLNNCKEGMMICYRSFTLRWLYFYSKICKIFEICLKIMGILWCDKWNITGSLFGNWWWLNFCSRRWNNVSNYFHNYCCSE